MSNHRDTIALIQRFLKLADAEPVVLIGDGSDHWAFEVNGAFIARVRKHCDQHTADDIEREAGLLDVVSRASPIPVPKVVAMEPQAGLIVFRRLPGISLLERLPSNPLVFAEPLAEFVASIHGIPCSLVEDLVEPDEYSLEAYRSDAIDYMKRAASRLSDSQRRCVERFLASSPPPESANRTFCHNDLGAEHILASDDLSRLTGIIDWSDAAIADPAKDVGRVLRDFGFGVAEAALRRTSGNEATLIRATFYARCALLEDLAYGIEESRPSYLDHALARLDETFAA